MHSSGLRFVKKELLGDFVSHLKHYIKKYYYSDGSGRCSNYCGIINERHFNRLKNVFEVTVKEGQKFVRAVCLLRMNAIYHLLF